MKRKKHVNLNNAREEDQEAAMKRIESRDECPFCLENLEKEHKEPILKKGEFWIVTKNQWPYDEAENHLLLISTQHIENLSNISPKAGKELIEFLQFIEKEFNFKAGGVGFRFGDINYNGATVSHLHVHVLEPGDSDLEDYEPIRFKIGN